jgi:hypothetical protein
MPLIKLFLAGNTSIISGFYGIFLFQGRSMPGQEAVTFLTVIARDRVQFTGKLKCISLY